MKGPLAFGQGLVRGFGHPIVDMRSQGDLLLKDLMKIEWSSFELS